LFLFSRGARVDAARQTPISDLALIQHYLRRADRRFAKNSNFLFYVFDLLNRQNMMRASKLQATWGNARGTNEIISKVTPEQIREALLQQRQAIDANRQGRPMPPAKLLLSLSNTIASSALGSNSERRKHRRLVESVIANRGPPQIFFTISPNDTGSVVVAQNAGLSMKAVDDFLRRLDDAKLNKTQPVDVDEFKLEDLPLKSDVWSAVSEDPAAAARAFQRFVEYVIDHVIGVDPRTGKTRAAGGVFGKVEFYYGLVESQVIPFPITITPCPMFH
jgi:hypothetical protein